MTLTTAALNVTGTGVSFRWSTVRRRVSTVLTTRSASSVALSASVLGSSTAIASSECRATQSCWRKKLRIRMPETLEDPVADA